MDDKSENRFSPEATGIDAPPSLNLDIDEEKLVKFIDSYTEQSKDYFNNEKHLKERREKNEKYFFGRQYGDKELKTYEKAYLDNVIKEGEDILRPLVLSRLPDLIVNPGTDSQVTGETADLISEAVNKTLQSDELKKILTKAFRHHPLYYTAIIKYFWNPHKGKMGDIDWQVIHPKNVLVDHTATSNDEKEMKIIVHYVEKSLSDWIMLFPTKEEEIKQFAREKGWKEDTDEEGMAFNIKIEEVWFDWKEKAKEFDPQNPEFEFKSGVLWKAGKKILDKRLNPNWDWEGEEKYVFNGKPIADELVPQIALLGMNIPGIESQKVFRNYFGRPRKPFIFMGYEQYGEMPYDETSRIEENILLQDNYDTRGMQVTKMIDDSRGKHVFSSLSGLKKETVEAMDLNNPDQDIYIDGDLRQVHSFLSKEQPSDAMFSDLVRTRERMMAKIHIGAPTRGEIQTSTATTNQIARESDFTVADDLSDLTINEMATKMAEALLHMMKLRYTPEHFQALIGTKGTDVQEKLTADVIEDGMEVSIKASGTDKLKAERQAKEEAQLQLIDPLSYFEDTERSDPKGRAERLFYFQTNPELYLKKYVEGMDLEQIAGQVMGMNQQNLAQAQGMAMGGQMEQPPMQPSVQNTGNIPTTPQGSPRSLIGRASGAVSKLFNR